MIVCALYRRGLLASMGMVLQTNKQVFIFTTSTVDLLKINKNTRPTGLVRVLYSASNLSKCSSAARRTSFPAESDIH